MHAALGRTSKFAFPRFRSGGSSDEDGALVVVAEAWEIGCFKSGSPADRDAANCFTFTCLRRMNDSPRITEETGRGVSQTPQNGGKASTYAFDADSRGFDLINPLRHRLVARDRSFETDECSGITWDAHFE